MAESAVQAPATPIWVDLASSDPKAAQKFYSALFNWEAQEGAPEYGGYAMFLSQGKTVAGVGPLMQEGQPTAWTSYVGSSNARESVEKIRSAGGTVLADAMDVMDQGTMAIAQDPTGAVFGIWQPNQMKGAELFNEPGALGCPGGRLLGDH